MRFIMFVVLVGGIGLAALWTSRSNAPHISEAQANTIAISRAQAIYHKPSQVVSAQFFADGGRSESKPGEKWLGKVCAFRFAFSPPSPFWGFRIPTRGSAAP